MSRGKDIGSQIVTRCNLAGAAAETAIDGEAVDITSLPGRPNTMRSVVVANFNADESTNLTASAIKLQSSEDANFITPVDRVAAPNLVIAGQAGDANVNRRGQVSLDYDLRAHMAAHPTHKWLRTTATPTRSDTGNTTAAIAAVHIYGGLQAEPQT